MNNKNKKLRSQEWFGGLDKMGFVHRSWLRNQGYPDDHFRGKPVIGICNTWSELTPCNGHLRDFAEVVKRGVLEAGGFPLEFPVMSLGETIMRPTTMLFRNLASMDVEESIRANPLDGVVLLTGCDKTTPSTLMGACSVDLPTIIVPGGPMLSGRFKGEFIGSGSFSWTIKETRIRYQQVKTVGIHKIVQKALKELPGDELLHKQAGRIALEMRTGLCVFSDLR